MPVFMYQLSYTAESLAAQLKTPQNRIETAARPAAEALGGKLLGGWYSFGAYDLVLILEMPDNESMAAVAFTVSAGGALKSSTTTVLMTGEQALAGMQKSAAVSKAYRPAS